MMHSAKGSISLPCLLAALLLALSAQLCLLYAVKGYEAEKDFLRGQQLRLLCGSVLQAIGQNRSLRVRSFAMRASCSRAMNR